MWRPVNLNRICATIHHGCMGLPQELVDHVMDMLYDDIPDLKACSLTCKAMFASTRPLIHRTLQLSNNNTLRVLSRGEKRRYERGDDDVKFRLISFMDKRGLLQYVRRVHICPQDLSTPEILSPHLHFQSLNQVHTLIIDHIYIGEWVNCHSSGFAHFYPTVTSLTLHRPRNRPRNRTRNHDLLLNFVLWFPNLENLSLEWLEFYDYRDWSVTDIAIPERTPPLRGCLRLVGHHNASDSSANPFHGPPKGFNFRSVELHDNFPGSQARHVLNACARTLENLTITARDLGNLWLPFLPSANVDRSSDLSIEHNELWYLKLTEMAVLRRLTLCTTFSELFPDLRNPLFEILSTIMSPEFCEFVLEFGSFNSPEICSTESWDPWRDFDDLFEERFARHGDFRLIIKSSTPSDWENLRRKAEWGFPLLADRGCITLRSGSVLSAATRRPISTTPRPLVS